MNKLYRALLVGALPLLAGCHAEPNGTTAQPPRHSPQAAGPRANAPTEASGAALPYLGYHRYRGTVGGRPVTVELTIDSTEAYPGKKLACTGSYYYGQANGGLLDLAAEGTYQPRQPLQLRESAGNKATGTWQATQPAGPLLAGTWSTPNGRQLPFELREDYTDGRGHLMAVRYEVLHEETTGPMCQPTGEQVDSAGDEELSEYDKAQRKPAELSRDALHLRGPDTLRPALAALQCEVPSQRRASNLAFTHDEGECTETSESLSVNFNDFGLLSVVTAYSRYYYGAPHFNHGASSSTYDLRTGADVTFETLLRPGADTLLQKLLTRHLLHDSHNEGDASVGEHTYGPGGLAGELVPLPDGVALSYTGLVCTYGEANISASLGYITLEVPYRELLPLLRPTSPVARMLRERGLWRRQ